MSINSALRGRWAFICGAAVGVLIAFPLAAPVFDGKILEPVATLWGNALGAMAAVAGAAWVAERQIAQQRKSAAALVQRMFWPTTSALGKLTAAYGPPSQTDSGTDVEPDVFSPEKWQQVAQQAKLVQEEFVKFNNRIQRYEAGLNLLSAHSLSTAMAMEAELEKVMPDTVARLTYAPTIYESGNVIPISQAPSRTARSALEQSNKPVQISMAKLEHDAS